MRKSLFVLFVLVASLFVGKVSSTEFLEGETQERELQVRVYE